MVPLRVRAWARWVRTPLRIGGCRLTAMRAAGRGVVRETGRCTPREATEEAWASLDQGRPCASQGGGTAAHSRPGFMAHAAGLPQCRTDANVRPHSEARAASRLAVRSNLAADLLRVADEGQRAEDGGWKTPRLAPRVWL